MQKKGFTLAEALVAMVVSGVVAIVAIPLFVEAKHDKDTAAKLNIAHTILANATEMNEISYGKITDKELENRTTQDIFVDFYRNNIKIITACKEDNSGNCWTPTKDFFQKGQTTDANKYGIGNTVHTGFVMQDGMNVSMTKVQGIDDKFGVETNSDYSVIFLVDVNGHKEPNTMGQDVFAFVLDSKGRIVPAGKDNDSANCKRGCDLDDDYWDCSARVIKEGKRDYM